MYQDKLAQLKKQLVQLKEGTLPEYMKKMRKIDQLYKERLRVNEIWLHYEMELVENEYIKEKKAAAKEFEEKKIDLKEQLILDLEEKKRQVESERNTMELTGDSMEVKAVMTRKLRRRPNDPLPIPEKRRKPSPDILFIILIVELRNRTVEPLLVSWLNYCLSEDEILDDLKIINKISGKPISKKPQITSLITSPASNDFPFDARIDDGKLYYDKKWFHRGQPVFLESKEAGKVSAVINCVGTQELWLRRTSDNGKLRVYVTQLQKGKYAIRRR
ncbi:hypothetical protein LSH36_3g13039 [Paralvinella palmiformis]|uniref:Sin3 histone deacetylase corepressor complex component SDS3 n=1 Tax=Paralvinella palmiformis TaxID=53620 RepID=A0AAD9KER4_9ANNE|nr:hypothetical protein LSH36_3g13039 [Paralvinella palmiformis]